MDLIKKERILIESVLFYLIKLLSRGNNFTITSRMTVHIRNLNIIVVPVHHPVGSAAVIHQAVSVPIIQAVPVVIQEVQVPVAISAPYDCMNAYP